MSVGPCAAISACRPATARVCEPVPRSTLRIGQTIESLRIRFTKTRPDMSTEIEKLRSRWGFHPCRFDLYVKLKLLHKWYWQTIYEFHRWNRWQRKESQNRVGPEPKFC